MAIQNHTLNQPKVVLLSQGRPLDTHALYSVVVESSLNRLGTAQVFVIDASLGRQMFAASDDPRLALGQPLGIMVGSGVGGEELFSGVVVRHTLRIHPDVGTLLCVELKHAAVAMSLVRKSASHAFRRDLDIVQALALGSGVALEASFPIEVVHENLLQYQVSDWDFMVMRAEANGCVVACEPVGLRIFPPVAGLQGAITLRTTDLLEMELERDHRQHYVAAESRAWNYLRQEPEQFRVESAPEAGMGSPAVIGMGTTGARGKEELRSWTEGRGRRTKLAALQGRLRLNGRTDLKLGSSVVLQGGSTSMLGPHLIAALRHEWTGSGWYTDLEVGMDPMPYAAEYDVNDLPVGGLLARMPGLQVGKVLKVQGDPLAQHRVQVALPSMPEGVEGIWARVASFDAGKAHGAFFRAQVDDEVVLGFLNEDPRDAIVLGGLFNGDAHQPSFDTAGGYGQQGLVTAAGLRVQFQEGDETILLQTPSGEVLALSGKGQETQGILIRDQFGNELVMGRDGIRIKSIGNLELQAVGSISIDAGAGLEAEAKGRLVAKGLAGAELSSNGMLDIKGALIKIN